MAEIPIQIKSKADMQMVVIRCTCKDGGITHASQPCPNARRTNLGSVHNPVITSAFLALMRLRQMVRPGGIDEDHRTYTED